jgi:hypothetical protein
VLVWIGAADGPAFIGKAEITSDAGVQKKNPRRVPGKILAEPRARHRVVERQIRERQPCRDRNYADA